MGHAQNPHYKRGLPRGEAARLAAPLVNLRVEPKSEGFQCELLSVCLPHVQPQPPSGVVRVQTALYACIGLKAFDKDSCSGAFNQTSADGHQPYKTILLSFHNFEISSLDKNTGKQPCSESRILIFTGACGLIWSECCRNSESSRQAEKRAAAGHSGLPEMYHQVSMRALHSSRFDDFDFGRHNPTRFAGLENGIANCYANALLQVCPSCICLCGDAHSSPHSAACFQRRQCRVTGNVSPSGRQGYIAWLSV